MVLTAIAFLFSLVLVADPRVRGHALGALVASGLDLAIAQGWVRLFILGAPLEQVIPGALVAFGLLMLFSVQSRPKQLLAVGVLVVGAVQLATRLGWV